MTVFCCLDEAAMGFFAERKIVVIPFIIGVAVGALAGFCLFYILMADPPKKKDQVDQEK